MDNSSCILTQTDCLSNLGLQRCDNEIEQCLGNGICLTTIIPLNFTKCICDICHYGDRCENELFSNNLWTMGAIMLHTPSTTFALRFLPMLFSCLQIVNSIVCLQTYLSSKKVRITNMGVYLTFNSVISLLFGLELFVQSIILFHLEKVPSNYFKISCYIDRKIAYISLTYIWGWSLFLISFERLLIECFQYSLYDSRRRSLVSLTLVSILCCLTTIPGIFTIKNLTYEFDNEILIKAFESINCVNYTSVGYIIEKIILSIHVYGTLASYLILCLIVSAHMLRHRKRIAPNCPIRRNIRFILVNHRDFFLPLVSTFVFSTPMLIIFEMMSCTKASKIDAMPYLMVVFGYVFSFIPTTISFFVYIYAANVYRLVFWQQSFIGKFLKKLVKFIKRSKIYFQK